MLSGLKNRSLLTSIKVKQSPEFFYLIWLIFKEAMFIRLQLSGLARSALRTSGCRDFHFKIEGRRSQDGTAKGQVC